MRTGTLDGLSKGVGENSEVSLQQKSLWMRPEGYIMMLA